MTDPVILEVTDGLGIEECPKCHSKEFILHEDREFRVNLRTEEVTEPSAYEDPTMDIINVRCAKCGALVSAEQDLVIFKSAIREHLKGELGRDPTDEEFLSFWDSLDTNIPEWLKTNARSWAQAKAAKKEEA